MSDNKETRDLLTKAVAQLDNLIKLVNSWESVNRHLKEQNDALKAAKPLQERSEKITLLEAYSYWLMKHSYLDTDWKDEPPFAIDEFLKEHP